MGPGPCSLGSRRLAACQLCHPPIDGGGVALPVPVRRGCCAPSSPLRLCSPLELCLRPEPFTGVARPEGKIRRRQRGFGRLGKSANGMRRGFRWQDGLRGLLGSFAPAACLSSLGCFSLYAERAALSQRRIQCRTTGRSLCAWSRPSALCAPQPGQALGFLQDCNACVNPSGPKEDLLRTEILLR